MRKIAALFTVLGVIALPLYAAATPTSAAPASAVHPATAAVCSGEADVGIYDASTHGYVAVGSGNRVVANNDIDNQGWYIYWDQQPTSPQYHQYALCWGPTGTWLTEEHDTPSMPMGAIITAGAASPWRFPQDSFFREIGCGTARDGMFMMNFPARQAWASDAVYRGNNAQLIPARSDADWVTVDSQCGVP